MLCEPELTRVINSAMTKTQAWNLRPWESKETLPHPTSDLAAALDAFILMPFDLVLSRGVVPDFHPMCSGYMRIDVCCDACRRQTSSSLLSICRLHTVELRSLLPSLTQTSLEMLAALSFAPQVREVKMPVHSFSPDEWQIRDSKPSLLTLRCPADFCLSCLQDRNGTTHLWQLLTEFTWALVWALLSLPGLHTPNPLVFQVFHLNVAGLYQRHTWVGWGSHISIHCVLDDQIDVPLIVPQSAQSLFSGQ